MDTQLIYGLSKPGFCLLIDQESNNENFKKYILDKNINYIQDILENKKDKIGILNQTENDEGSDSKSQRKIVSKEYIRLIVKESENEAFRTMVLSKKVNHIQYIIDKKQNEISVLHQDSKVSPENDKCCDSISQRKTILENLIRLIVNETESVELKKEITKAKRGHYKRFLTKMGNKNDLSDKYDKVESGYRSGRESLRHIQYFIEDYVNKEFDVFMSLSSDNYLDYFYKNIFTLKEKGQWVTHGNGSMFSNSVNIDGMQMDNLAYNINEEILVANELKLGGGKNPDQILKYCFMFHDLKKKEFISQNSQFVLLFISDKKEEFELNEEIDKEVSHLRKDTKKAFLITPEAVNYARNMSVKSITWHDIINLNEVYSRTLLANQQVEMKLIKGFNTSLKEKADLYSLYQNE